MKTWPTALGDLADPPQAFHALALLVGPAHRLAHSGQDLTKDRAFATDLLEAALNHHSDDLGPLAAVLGWWLRVALGRSVSIAWEVARLVPGPTGEELQSQLTTPRLLDAIAAPARREEALGELKRLSVRNPGKIVGDKAILTQANEECQRVLRAARDGQPFPHDLRLARADQDELWTWAGEGQAGRRVEEGTPIWDHLIKQLQTRAATVQTAMTLWEARPSAELRRFPPTAERDLRGALGEGHLALPLALALAQDLLPEPPPRPLLQAEASQVRLQILSAAASSILYRLGREAWQGEEGKAPSWWRGHHEALHTLKDEVNAQLADLPESAGESREMLQEALAALDRGELNEARSWRAEAQLPPASPAAEPSDPRAATRALARRLLALDALLDPEPAAKDPPEAWRAWEDEVRAVADDLKRTASSRLEQVQATLGLFLPEQVSAARGLASEANRLLQAERLDEAEVKVLEAETQAYNLLSQAQEELAMGLRGLWEEARNWPPFDRAAWLERLRRLTAAQQRGLNTLDEQTALNNALDRMRRGHPLTWVCARRGEDWAPIGSLPGAIQRSDLPIGPVRAVGELGLAGPAPDLAAAEVEGWTRLVPSTAPAPAGRHLRLEVDEVTGPWTGVDGASTPVDPRGVVVRLHQSQLRAYFCLVSLGQDDVRLPFAPSLDDLLAARGVLEDGLGPAQLQAWVRERLVLGLGPEAGQALAAALSEAARDDLPPAVADLRQARAAALLQRAEALAAERQRLVAAFLDSPAGQEARQQALDAWMAQAKADRRAALEAALGREEADWRQATESRRAALNELTSLIEDRTKDLKVLDELLDERRNRWLALAGRRPDGTTTEAPPPEPAEPAEPWRVAPFAAREASSLAELVSAVAGRSWSREAVGNLLLSTLTGRWTLLAGLPGVGKSTFVRSVLTRLGVGPSSERYLELVVRRDWQDDAALFGFWHPSERSWSPSSEGLVEHLLRAEQEARGGGGGLWPVLLEELNLASPEYYLARPLSAFEANPSEIRLYDPTLRPKNAGRYPARFVAPPAVRMLGTVNVDDTVERLSPRFLSRASVIWIGPSSGVGLWKPEEDEAVAEPRWSTLQASLGSGEAPLGPIGELIERLQQARIPGAPTQRTRRAISAYLAAAPSVLPPERAYDLQILQRVLPPLRGTGSSWRELLDRMADYLERNHCAESAARTREVRDRGEELGDWYDFFHA